MKRPCRRKGCQKNAGSGSGSILIFLKNDVLGLGLGLGSGLGLGLGLGLRLTLTINLTITLNLTLTLTLTRTWTRIQIPRFTDTTKKLGTVNLNYIAKDSTNKFLRQYLCWNFSSRLLYIFHTFQVWTFSREIFN